jgi:hypothetical protein
MCDDNGRQHIEHLFSKRSSLGYRLTAEVADLVTGNFETARFFIREPFPAPVGAGGFSHKTWVKIWGGGQWAAGAFFWSLLHYCRGGKFVAESLFRIQECGAAGHAYRS